MPVVAIGGITLGNVGEVAVAGGVAVCSAIISDGDPMGMTRAFLERLGS